MSYAEKFLKAHGQNCTIKRTPIVVSKVSIKRSTKSTRDLGSREAYWEGLILLDVSLASGEVITIGSDDYLVQSTNFDPASGVTAFFAAKSNAALTHKRLIETLDTSNNVSVSWSAVNVSVTAYGEIVTYQLRQFDPGLLEQTRYIFQVPKFISAVAIEDRIVYNNKNYMVVSIDDTALQGVVRLQLGIDVRPD